MSAFCATLRVNSTHTHTHARAQANYAVVSYIAEFLNTISSVAITVFAAIGLYQARKHHAAARTLDFTLAYGGVMLVGVGSALFHATLKHYEQYMDEVPMLIAASTFVYIMLKDPSPQAQAVRWGYNAAVACAIGFLLTVAVVTYVLLDVFFLFFMAYFFACAFLVVYPCYGTGCFRLANGEGPQAASITTARRHFIIAAIFYHLGFLSWLWEHFRCLHDDGGGTFSPQKNRGWETKILPLHAMWHLGAGLGSTYYVGFLVCLRAAKLKKPSEAGHCCYCWLYPASCQAPCDVDGVFEEMDEQDDVFPGEGLDDFGGGKAAATGAAIEFVNDFNDPYDTTSQGSDGVTV